jgi:hypothetical protein
MLALLTTSLLTSYGDFSYTKITKEKAQELLETNKVQSFIRHQGIIDILKEDFNIDIQMNNGLYQQQSGETALVFKLNNDYRLSSELNVSKIKEIGYSFGLLIKK